MQTGMLGDNEALRRLWDGLLKDLMLKLNGSRGPEYEEGLRKLLRDELIPIPVSTGTAGIIIVKAVTVVVGGRTTDQIVADAQGKYSYVNPDIKQTNMPSGHGRRRSVVLEFFEFDHDPTTEEICARCEEPGYWYSTYEDGLRYQEDHFDGQQERRPHVFFPENPWRPTGSGGQALGLWGHTGGWRLDLGYCAPEEPGWFKLCIFARRKYC